MLYALPLTLVSSQSHLGAGRAAGLTQGALSALAGSGVSEVAITELDIVGAAANDYVTAVKACLAVSACVGITVCIPPQRMSALITFN